MKRNIGILTEGITKARKSLGLIVHEDFLNEVLSDENHKLFEVENFAKFVYKRTDENEALFNKLLERNQIKEPIGISANIAKIYSELQEFLYLEYNFVVRNISKLLADHAVYDREKEAKSVIQLALLVFKNEPFNIQRELPYFPKEGTSVEWIAYLVALQHLHSGRDDGKLLVEYRKILLDKFEKSI